jgi:hypothetical protein
LLDFTDVVVWNHWQGRSDVSDVLVSRGASLDTFNDYGYQRKHTSLMSQPLLTEREHPLLRSDRLPDLFTGLYDA